MDRSLFVQDEYVPSKEKKRMALLNGKLIYKIERKSSFTHAAHSTNRNQCTSIEILQDVIKTHNTTPERI